MDRRRVLIGLGLVILAGLIIAYVSLNPPLLWIVRRLAGPASGLVIVMSFAGWGALVVPRLLPCSGRTDAVLASVAVGMGISAGVTWVAGILGIVSPPLYASWLLLGLMLLAGAGRRWFVGVPRIEPGHPLDAAAAALIAVVVLHLLPVSATPAASTDELQYHLLIPRIHFENGRIGPIPTLVEAGYPSLAEEMYLLVGPLMGEAACKGLHLTAGLLVLIAVGRLAVRCGAREARLLAPALLLSLPVFAVMLPVAWNDAFFVLFMVLGLTALVDHHRLRPQAAAPGSLVLAGVMLGLAAWTKYTIVLMLLALLPLLAIAVWRWRWRWIDPALVLVPAALVVLPTLVRNLVYTGNPVYPFLDTIFDNPYWNEAAASYFHHALRRFEMPDIGGWGWLWVPLRLTLLPRLVDTHPGVLPLVMLPLIALRPRSAEARFLRGFVLLIVPAWLLIQTEMRSLLAPLAVLCALAVPGVERVWAERWARPAIVVLLAAAWLTTTGIIAVNTLYLTRPIPYLLGRETRAQFLHRESPSQPAFDWLDRHPEDGAVLLVGQAWPYHLDRPYLFSSFSDPPIAETVTAGRSDPSAIRRRLKELGVGHVVVHWSEWERQHQAELYSWSDAQRRAFERFLQEAEPVARFGAETVYRVR